MNPMAGHQDFAVDPRNAGLRTYGNGSLVPRDQARVSVLDAGFVLGDGVWASAWCEAVECSTGFAAPERRASPVLPDALKRITDAAQPHFEGLYRHRLTFEPVDSPKIS